MKLIVQIPCYNEEATLPAVIESIPRAVDGIDRVEILVVDDGSTDRTGAVALEAGAHHLRRHRTNKGLARAFRTGMDAALELGADVVVNLDGDNQYDATGIPRLVEPILAGDADIVVGDRRVSGIPHFSWLKRSLHRIGSAVVRALSGLDVPDPVSGFRAISRKAALQLNIVSPFSYTIEMLIQAGYKGLAVESVPIRTTGPTRPSRLFGSIGGFVASSTGTMARIYTMYQPLRPFAVIGTLAMLGGAIPIARFLWFWWQGDGSGHIQSLVLGAGLTVIGTVTLLMGVLADLVGRNRQLLEMVLERTHRLELQLGTEGRTRERRHRATTDAAVRDERALATSDRLSAEDGD